MARSLSKLTSLQVKNLKKPGRYSDGGGLYLVIGKDGSRKWVFRYQVKNKRRDAGLGSALLVGLAEAREAADRSRRQVRDGLDPIVERRKTRLTVPTFQDAAALVHQEQQPTWRNEKHANQWLSSLQTYAFPEIGDTPVDQITGPMVRDVLAAIWLEIPETARRVRQRIGTVLDWSHSKGYRPAPLDMRGISRGLPRQPRNDTHFRAMPFTEVPGFIQRLQGGTATDGVKRALELLILTAARSGEIRGMRWNEIDMKAKTWTVPAERMKASKEHAVPLSARALEILADQRRSLLIEDTDGLVFEGNKAGRPISDMTLTQLLRRAGDDFTVHGFRSSFRDWAAEATNFPREVAEQALAHAIDSRVERAYRRSDLLEKRRKMMAAWSRHCAAASATVVPLQSRRH